MLLHTQRSKLTEQHLLDAFHCALDSAGCIAVPAAFQVLPPEPDEPTGRTEAALTGPNKVNEADRTVSGVANVFSVSRTDLRLHIDGLDVTHYNQWNPVVLASHCAVSSNLMPGAIGRIEKVYKAAEGTELRFRNMKFDTDALAEAWYQKVLAGTVRMVSVGVLPIEWSVQRETVGKGKAKREIVFLDMPESELLEISVVAIGANRGALIGQTSPYALLERVAASEQRAAALHDAIATFLKSEHTAAAEQARVQLMTAVARFQR